MYNKFVAVLVAILVGWCLSCMSGVSAQEERKKLLFVSDPWPPYITGDLGRPAKGGVAVDFARELLQRLGFEMRSMLYPWKHSINMIKTNAADLIFPLIQNPERDEFMTFSQTVFVSHDRIWFLKSKLEPLKWSRLSDLYGYRLGKIKGYSHGDELDQAVEENKFAAIVYGENHLINLTRLIDDEVDLVIADEQVIQMIIRRNSDWRNLFGFTRKAINKSQYKIGFAKDSPVTKHMDKLNQEIKRMRSDGSLRRIFSNY
ncbi:transporter substrate-binding domain-containing protein [Endozoicomonas sp. SM1973]|uniref:Transporter substrate-binding domain-containing protein n=1 Tax=Spartinivicinus marinus TaxID=2994442 RepID=A0A853HY66_9GAMM|nr:transporter substrate-binding domain-containing protein [Spartinivicinus marinus]MCX4025462.1 transporter substrate-binding domain-containing protein [Spartinivicinus marinus]NYZ65309.1 transporter substrate-binding domain-containing protein [Spartinivicinus marinus]